MFCRLIKRERSNARRTTLLLWTTALYRFCGLARLKVRIINPHTHEQLSSFLAQHRANNPSLLKTYTRLRLEIRLSYRDIHPSWAVYSLKGRYLGRMSYLLRNNLLMSEYTYCSECGRKVKVLSSTDYAGNTALGYRCECGHEEGYA